MEISALQRDRLSYKPKLPTVLQELSENLSPVAGAPTESVADQAELQKIFPKSYGKPIVTFAKGQSNLDLSKPLRIGVILSGGQAPGGHNVITGIFDTLLKANPDNRLYGFLGGPAGIMERRYVELTTESIDQYRNTGGFDLIGSGRDKIETMEQFAAALSTSKWLELNAVIVIGGDDSNTNAALLAEYFLSDDNDIQVIGVPKTIDGDLKNEYIETSFGFDTACKTYSEMIGNIARDANSARKYWHFVKLMGRSASHIALECALQTRPNLVLISEEVEAKALSLSAIIKQITDAVVSRAEAGNNFGLVLIPEGLIEFIPEVKVLIKELNDTLAHASTDFSTLAFADQIKTITGKISSASADVFTTLPTSIQAQLMLDRDPHGNVQVSLIETEKLLIDLVKSRLGELKKAGSYKGKFSGIPHFFGYEGRCAFPSNFDADYCYALGTTAFLLAANRRTGYLASVRNLSKPASEWVAGGIPLTMLMNLEQRHGKLKPVIRKALVELDGPVFEALEKDRASWVRSTDYRFPGAIQYYGPTEVCDTTTITLELETAGLSKK